MNVHAAIASQYHASLEMLGQAVVACPDSLWEDRSQGSAFWHIAYHALFFAHFYLQPSAKQVTPWPGKRGEYELLRSADESGIAGPAVAPYTKDEILEYLAFCRQQVDERLASIEFEAPSGFPWLPFDKLELQIYSIRHLQQHTGELQMRLGVVGIQVNWVGMGCEGDAERG